MKGGLNTYGYVGGNPLKYFDRFGLDAAIDIPWELPAWCTKLAGGVFSVLAGLQGDTRQEDCSGGGGGNSDRERHCKSDDCSEITQTIASLTNDVERRYEELLIDRHGLFGLPNPHPDYGSWAGHVYKYVEIQEDLRNAIALAKSKGCPVDPNAEMWANEPPPSSPFSG